MTSGNSSSIMAVITLGGCHTTCPNSSSNTLQGWWPEFWGMSFPAPRASAQLRMCRCWSRPITCHHRFPEETKTNRWPSEPQPPPPRRIVPSAPWRLGRVQGMVPVVALVEDMQQWRPTGPLWSLLWRRRTCRLCNQQQHHGGCHRGSRCLLPISPVKTNRSPHRQTSR